MSASEINIIHKRKSICQSTETTSAASIMDMENFQNCLDDCTFGKYQFRLISVAFVQGLASATAITNLAYILPNAECDLRMTLNQKGLLTAVPYIGMLGSGFIAGFLTDTFGRRTMLLICLYGMFISICVQGASQTFGVLAGAKAVEGFLFNGSYCACTAFLSEFTTTNTRDRVMLTNSSFLSVGQIVLALIAWAILPQNWNIVIYEETIILRSWNFFLYAGGIFSLTAGVLFSLYPESPKYNFARGRYDEAFATLRRIYSMNTGKPPETFPHNVPKQESIKSKGDGNSLSKTLRESFRNLKPLFKKPLISYLLIVICVQGVLMMGYNTMRLWYPQISTIVEKYKPVENNTTNLCMMLDSYIDIIKNKISTTVEEIQKCTPNKSGAETYINSIIMGLACCVPYLISGLIINIVGKKILIVSFMTICTATCAGLYWATDSIQVAALFSTFVALAQTSISILLTISLEVFPTVCKSFAISLIFMTGRLATLFGNTVFPVLLAQSCIVPFISIASTVGFAAILALFLPVVKK